MHLTNCLHPLKITKNGYEQYVPCGKCDYCKYIRSSARSYRLSLEIQSHKFAVFTTLTYADMFLPKMVYDSYNRVAILPKYSRGSSEILPDEECTCFKAPFLSKSSAEIIKSRTEVLGCVPVLSKRDAQLFMKRVRINLKRKLNYSNEEKEKYQISYALCGEYGPTTIRPHMHCILMFDEGSILSNIFEVIHTSWPFGSSRTRILGPDENGAYISKYINFLHKLPSIFRAKEIRPFFLASKSHPLGLYKIQQKEIQELVITQSPVVHVENVRKQSFSLVPLWPTLENWFFPKFSGFDSISDRCRIRLLGAALQSSSVKEFVNIMYDSDLSSWRSYFVSPGNFQFDEEYCNYLIMYYKSCSVPPSDTRFLENSLKSIYYCAQRIRRNMHKYCINSLEEYLDIIKKYYHNKESFRLEQQFKLEQAVMLHQPELIDSIDLRYFSDDVIDSFDIKPILSRMYSDINHSHKNKRKQEYLAAHPEYSINSRPDDFSEGFL